LTFYILVLFFGNFFQQVRFSTLDVWVTSVGTLVTHKLCKFQCPVSILSRIYMLYDFYIHFAIFLVFL
jgi:hypothetical protein